MRGSRVLLALAFPILACLAGCRGSRLTESELALYRYSYQDPFAGMFIAGESAASGTLYRTRQPIGRVPQSFIMPKPPGTRRVFLIGGSVAQMFGWDSSRRPTLAEALRAAQPGGSVEVVDCGSSGSDSARDALVLTEVLRYSPDLIVLMTGANEGEMLPPEGFSRACLRLLCAPWLHPLGKFGLGAAVFSMRVLEGRDAFAGKLARNLRRMLSSAELAKVPVVVCTLPYNLRDWPPPGALPLGDGDFFSAWMPFERAEWPAAAAGLRRWLEAHPRSLPARYLLARALDRAGRRAEARSEYLAVLSGSVTQVRPLPRANEVLRAGAAGSGAAVADLERLLESLSPDGLPGWDLFEDDVHWERFVDPLISVAIASAAARGTAGPGLGRLRRAAEKGARPSGLGAERSWTIFRYRMWRPLQSRKGLFNEQVLSFLETIQQGDPALLRDAPGLRDWLRRRMDGNLWDKDAAASLEAWWPVLLAHVGEFHRRRGDHARAISCFAQALSLDPRLGRARLHKVVAHWSMGQKKEAFAELAQLSWLDRPPETALRLREHGITVLRSP